MSLQLTIPSEAQVRFSFSLSCAGMLSEDLPSIEQKLRYLINGDGEALVVTAGELASHFKNSHTIAGLLEYSSRQQRSHKAVYVILPEHGKHLFQTMATTYLDNPTPYFIVSKDLRWLAIESTANVPRKPVHMLVFRELVDEWTYLHETHHLNDIEALHGFAQSHLTESGQQLQVRFDVFKIITELRAYKLTGRSRASAEALDDDAKAMVGDISPVASNLAQSDWQLIADSFGISSMDLDGARDYLRNLDRVPSLIEVLSKFDSSTIRLVNPIR